MNSDIDIIEALPRMRRGVGLRRLLRREYGAALVELAMITTIFGVPLLCGTAVIAHVVYSSIEVANAAHAAALYGMQSATVAANTSGIVLAARNEASDFGSSLVVTPSIYYACSNAVAGTQYTGSQAQANAEAACTGGNNHALEFVQVSTSVAVTPPIRCVGLPTSYTVKGYSVMEVQQ